MAVAVRAPQTFYDAGAIGDGSTDDTAAVQAAFNYSAANAVSVYGGPGVYKITSAIKVPSGARIIMDPQCVLLRAYTQRGTTGLLMNADMRAKIKDVRIEGGVIRNSNITTFQGNQVCLNGDDVHINNLYIDEWGDTSRAMVLYGNRIQLDRIFGVHSGNGGGIRFAGGEDFKCSNSHIKCGDDCYNFVPTGPAGLLADQTIKRSQYVNCTGDSFNARLFLAVTSSGGIGDLDMTCSILDCAFIGIRGKGSNIGVQIENRNSTGKVARISVTDCMVDNSADTTSGQAVFIRGVARTGGVEDVWFKNLTVLGPRGEVVDITGPLVDRIHFDGFYFEMPRDSRFRPVRLRDLQSGSLTNGYLKASDGGSAIVVTNDNNRPTKNILIENVTGENITNNYALVHVAAGRNIAVRRCTVRERAGQTGAYGVRFDAGASDCHAEENDFSELSNATKFLDSGTNNLFTRNLD